MAPLLIDSRDVLKLGLISVLVTVLTFAGGFLFGHQRATIFYQAGTELKSLSLPEKDVATDDTVNSRVPSVIEAGEEIDVDQPETITLVNSGKNDLAPEYAASAAVTNYPTAESLSALPEKVVDGKKDVVLQPESNRENLPATENIAQPQIPEIDTDIGIEAVNDEDVGTVATFTSDDLSKIKYSIQAGVYGRLINAENMVKMLQMQKYDAYVTDYRNKKNETRYNVRFGYFSDKKSAIAALGKFKHSKKGDGYLVRFSSENIVNIAGVDEIEQATEAPVKDAEMDKDLMPVTTPPGLMQDKVSQADVITPVDLLNDSFTKTN